MLRFYLKMMTVAIIIRLLYAKRNFRSLKEEIQMNEIAGTLMVIGMVIIATLATHHSKEKRMRRSNKESLNNWNNKGKRRR